jgi:hypothetical protein
VSGVAHEHDVVGVEAHDGEQRGGALGAEGEVLGEQRCLRLPSQPGKLGPTAGARLVRAQPPAVETGQHLGDTGEGVDGGVVVAGEVVVDGHADDRAGLLQW